ncbi:unnamed protein product [Caretta caretta]
MILLLLATNLESLAQFISILIPSAQFSIDLSGRRRKELVLQCPPETAVLHHLMEEETNHDMFHRGGNTRMKYSSSFTDSPCHHAAQAKWLKTAGVDVTATLRRNRMAPLSFNTCCKLQHTRGLGLGYWNCTQ